MDSSADKVDNTHEWLKLADAARHAGRSEKTLRRYIADGRLPAHAVQSEPTHAGFRYLIRREALDTLTSTLSDRTQLDAALARIGSSMETLESTQEATRTVLYALVARVEDLGRVLPAAEAERGSEARRIAQALDELRLTIAHQGEQIARLNDELEKAGKRSWWARLMTLGRRQ